MATEIGRGVIPVTFDKDAIAKDLQSSALPAFQRLATDAAALFVGKKLFDIGKAGLEELKEAGVVAAQTAAAIKSTGGAAGVTAEEIDGLASSLSAMSGKDDEAIASAENLLLTFTNIKNTDTAKTFDDATAAALDLSVAFGKDLQSSAILVGKALNDPATGLTALQKVGVAFTAEQKNVIQSLVDTGDVAGAQAVILEELNRQVGGSAEAYGKTLAGSMERAQTAMDNAKGAMVGGLAPAIQIGADLAVKMAEGFTSLPEPLQQVAGGVALVGGGILSLARPVNDTIALFSRFRTVQETSAVAAEVLTVAEGEQAVATEALAVAQTKQAAAAAGSAAASKGMSAGLAITAAAAAAAAIAYGIFVTRGSGADALVKSLKGDLDKLGDSFSDLSVDARGSLEEFATGLNESGRLTGILRDLGQTTGDFAGLLLESDDALKEFTISQHDAGEISSGTAVAIQLLKREVEDEAKAALEAATANSSLTQEQRDGAEAALAAGDESGNYAAALSGLGDTLGGTIDATGKFVEATGKSEEEMIAAREAAEKFNEQTADIQEAQEALAGAIDDVASALESAYGATLDPARLAADLEEATDDLTASLKLNGIVIDKNTGLLADNTEEQRDVLSATEDVGEVIAELIAARFEETGSLVDAQEAGIDYVEGLKEQLRQAGFTKQQVADLIETMHLTPEEIRTTFSTNSPEVQAVVAELHAEIEQVPVEWQTTLNAYVDEGELEHARVLLDALAADRVAQYFLEIYDTSDVPTLISGGLEGKASGGPVAPGQVFRGAEQGYELLVSDGLYQAPPSGGYVVPHAESEQFLAGLGGGGGFTFNAGGIVVQGADARDALEELPDVTRAMMHLLVPA